MTCITPDYRQGESLDYMWEGHLLWEGHPAPIWQGHLLWEGHPAPIWQGHLLWEGHLAPIWQGHLLWEGHLAPISHAHNKSTHLIITQRKPITLGHRSHIGARCPSHCGCPSYIGYVDRLTFAYGIRRLLCILCKKSMG